MRRSTAPADAAGRDGVPAAFAWALVALLAVLHASPFMLTFIEGDFARDLDAATRMVQGEAWPLRGPVLAWTLHLGPAWYWLLALPLAIARSVAAGVGLVAILSALQFPLAYRLGVASAGRGMGLGFAAFLALPGLTTLQGLWIAHPSLVPTATLAVALCSWHAWARSSWRWWLASMLAASLALHAHPTTLPVLILPLVAAARALRAGGGVRVGALILGSVAFLLPFAPLAWNAAAQAHDLATFAAGVATDVARLAPGRWLDAMASLAWRVPDAVAAVTLSHRPGAPAGFRMALAALYGFVVVGTARAFLQRDGRARAAVAATLAAFALTVALAVAVRDTTRSYMLYAAWVPFAAWLAASVSALPATAIAGVRLRVVPVALAVALSVASGGAWLLRALGGEVRVPALLLPSTDLSRGVPRGHLALATLTPLDVDRLGRHLCDAGEVRAFGELAGIVDALRNVPGRLTCGDAGRVTLGGIDGPGSAWYLVHAAAIPQDAQHTRLGAFALGRVAGVHAPALALPLAQGDDYPWRRACGAPVAVTVRFTAHGPGRLVVSNALPVTCPMTLRRIDRDGSAVEADAHLDSHVVVLPAGDSAWEVAVDIGEPRALQVFTIAGGG